MESVWLNHYEKKIPHHINIDELCDLSSLAHKTYKQFSDRPAFSCMNEMITFKQLGEYSSYFAGYLQNVLKLSKGERVAIMLPNVLQYPVALHGIFHAGMIAVNVNPLYTPRELKHQLVDSGASTIIILENFAHVLSEVIKDTNIKHVIIAKMGDLFKFPKNYLVNFVVKYIKKMVPTYQLESKISFKEIMASKKSYTPQKISLSDPAFLQYTGGTTGVSKGAILSHKNIAANVAQAKAWISNHVTEGEEIIITALPLYHIFSLTANCLTYGAIGAHNILITNPRDFTSFIKTLKQYPFTTITGVNTLFNALNNHKDFPSVDFSKLKFTLGGGMAVQKSVAEAWHAITKNTLIQAYGLTESSPAACINPLNLENFNGSIGLPLSSTEISIRNDNLEELTFNQEGELWIRGPQVMVGYWNRAEETENTLTKDGWLKTGDVATVDEQGFVRIVDRKKDMIIVSGFNVYPNEIEEIACMHPKIIEAAAIGVDDKQSGETVKLFVVAKSPDLTKEEIITHCRKYLTNYKVPKIIEFRKELPKTNVGKILRRALKE